MLNKEKHQLIMGQILKDLYTDVSISSLLGFKGGTACYFFYQLPRFSVDLDFDLLGTEPDSSQLVFDKIVAILSRYGQIKDAFQKRFTLFALLSYGDEEHNIKIEVNLRTQGTNVQQYYELREYLGISIRVAKKEYMFANKLLALTLREKTAMRDVFDIHFFAINQWDIDTTIISEKTGKNVKSYLQDCVAFIETIKENQLLQGLGELVNGEKEKTWVREHLKADTIFLLKNYISVMK